MLQSLEHTKSHSQFQNSSELNSNIGLFCYTLPQIPLYVLSKSILCNIKPDFKKGYTLSTFCCIIFVFFVEKWYFVTIIVLTYCEKKFSQCEEKKLRKKFANSRPLGREFVMFLRFYFPCTRTIFSTVSQKYYGNRLLFRLFRYFPMNSILNK